MELCYESESAQLWHGKASEYAGRIDLVLTQVYGDVPDGIWGAPTLSIVSGTTGRTPVKDAWHMVGMFNISAPCRQHCTVYAINMDDTPAVDLSDLYVTDAGWFPLEVPFRLLQVYGKPGMTVWDGFMGRGTVGKAALELGMQFVGIDQRLDRVEMARDYLGL